MNYNIELKWNNELIISALFFGPQINYYLALILSMHGLRTLTTFVYAVLFVLGIFSYLKNLKNKNSVISVVILFSILLISYLINPSISLYMFSENIFSSSLIVLLFLYFPCFLLLLKPIDYSKLSKLFLKFSYITIVIAIIAFIEFVFIQKSTPPDYMSFAYMMLTPILICFIFGTEGQLGTLILSLIGGFIVFIVGCRGAVISLAIFALLYFVFYYFPRKGKGYGIWKALISISLILVVSFFERILTIISYGLKFIGFNSRTVNKIISGDGSFIESEGRKEIWAQSLKNIGLIGKGLFGDRTVIRDEYFRASYAHNLFIEILIDFGWIIGLVILVFVIVLVIKSIKYAFVSKSPFLIKMCFAIFSIVFVKHMISSSFLVSFDFWFYFGLAASIVINRNDLMNDNSSNTLKVNAQ